MKTMRYVLVLGLIALMTMVLAACGEDGPDRHADTTRGGGTHRHA